MLPENRALVIVMIICMVGISGIAIYKLVTKGEPAYIQFAIVASLGHFILKQLPLFVKYKYLNAIPVLAAVILLAVGIFTEIKN